MTTRKGFTLIELMIVVAIIAIIAAIAIPGLLRARIASNETSSIGTLRTLSTSEAQFQSAAIVDQDTDGTGEFGFFQELSGTVNYRTDGGNSAAPASPSFITSVLGSTANTDPNGLAGKSGYSYRIFLPSAIAAIPEPGGGVGPGNLADANNQEVRFCGYAWPASLGNSGNRAFAVNHAGEVFATANKDVQDYDGTINPIVTGMEALVDPLAGANLEGQFITGDTGTGDGAPWIPAGN